MSRHKYQSCAESLMRKMSTRTRKENRRAAFENYKRKHHLDDCTFFCIGNNLIIVRDKKLAESMKERSYYNEISAPHTLVKYVKMAYANRCSITVHDLYGRKHYSNIEEVKEDILVEKLAGLL